MCGPTAIPFFPRRPAPAAAAAASAASAAEATGAPAALPSAEGPPEGPPAPPPRYDRLATAGVTIPAFPGAPLPNDGLLSVLEVHELRYALWAVAQGLCAWLPSATR